MDGVIGAAAADSCRWDEVAAALDAGFPVNAAGGALPGRAVARPLLHPATQFGHMPTLTRLLEAGADANARCHGDWTPAHRAALHGRAPALEALVKAGASVNAATMMGFTPLFHATQPTCPLCLRYLLGLPHTDLGAVNIRGETAELYARRVGRARAAGAIGAEVCEPVRTRPPSHVL